jgi:hypothetical protein
MISIRFSTEIYSVIEVTLRNSVDGWGTDIPGNYVNGAWVYELDGTQYENGFDFKFFLPEQGAWSYGSNLRAPAGSSGTLSFDADTVRFLLFIELDPGDYSLRGRFSLRSDVDGWVVDLPVTSTSDSMQQWGLEWGRYRDGLEFKFLLTSEIDETGSVRTVWMMGSNLSVKPSAGAYYTYHAAHAGPITFPFFIRFVTQHYATARITLRDQANGWQDRAGSYEDGAWLFSVPWTDYFDSSVYGPIPFRGKFLLNGIWMTGPNIQIGPDEPWQGGSYVQVAQSYDYGEDVVRFPPGS